MKKIVFSLVACLALIVFSHSGVSAQDLEEYSNRDVTPFAQYNYFNQDVTAYTGSTKGHGATYGYYNSRFSTVAVHKNSSNVPYLPFGTLISLTSLIALPNENGTTYKSAFTVTDTGTGPGKSSYWLDIYYGADSTANRDYARKFGTNGGKKISYSAYYQ